MDIHAKLRSLLADAVSRGRTLKSIAADASVPYDRLGKWLRGDTAILDVADADAVLRLLTGEGVLDEA